MHRTLRAVDNAECALRTCQGQQLGKRLPAAKHVGQLRERQQAGARADQPSRLLQIDAAGVIQRQYHQLEIAALGQLLPGQQIGVVLQRADDDLLARLQQMLQTIGQQVE